MQIPPEAVPLVNVGAFVASFYVTKSVNKPTSALSKAIGASAGIGGISRRNQCTVNPASWALKPIWGLIYGLETASCLWQIGQGAAIAQQLVQASPWWIAASASQAAWICVFCTEEKCGQRSFVPMAAIAYSLWQVFTQTNSIAAACTAPFILGRLPYAIHFSWVTCATFVSANQAIASSGVSPGTQNIVGLVTEVVAALLGSYISVSYKDPTPALVTAYALLAISDNKNSKQLPAYSSHIKATAVIGCVATGAVGVYVLLKDWLGVI